MSSRVLKREKSTLLFLMLLTGWVEFGKSQKSWPLFLFPCSRSTDPKDYMLRCCGYSLFALFLEGFECFLCYGTCWELMAKKGKSSLNYWFMHFEFDVQTRIKKKCRFSRDFSSSERKRLAQIQILQVFQCFRGFQVKTVVFLSCAFRGWPVFWWRGLLHAGSFLQLSGGSSPRRFSRSGSIRRKWLREALHPDFQA